MRIIFICGSLEPGKDGVGDYTRRLCGELLKQGVTVGMLAYNDKHLHNKMETIQESDGYAIPSLRLPHTWKSKARCKEAKAWIDLQNPEWLSLQFVPYAFHNKGVPVGLGRQLKEMGTNRKWHIMFHELWLGLRNNDSIKFRVIGFLQRKIVYFLIKKINLEVVHTHTQFYIAELLNMGLSPNYLPIFSNIPFNKITSENIISDIKKITFVIFGTIHPNAPVKQFAEEVFDYFSSKKELNCNLIIIGKTGAEHNNWVKEFHLLGIDVKVYGELKEEEVSYVLQDASFGITTNPIFVVEKSGTVAAMREHNLPVIIVAENTRPKNDFKFNFDSNMVEYKVGNFCRLMNKKYDKLPYRGVSEISIQFLKDINVEQLTLK